jgi:hypothetical protein
MGWQRSIRGDVPDHARGNRASRASKAREHAGVDYYALVTGAFADHGRISDLGLAEVSVSLPLVGMGIDGADRHQQIEADIA